MNYDGHEALRRDMAGLANNLCDLKTTLKVLEDTYHYRYDGLAERLAGNEPGTKRGQGKW